MDPAQDMEGLGVPALEIDGHDREPGLLDELDDVFRPRDVFHDLSLPEGGPVLPLLPGSHLAGREQAQGMLVRDMAQRRPDAGNAPGAAAGEIVHRDETVLEARDHRQEEGRQDLVVRTAGAHHGAQDHAVQAAVMVVGDRDESAFLGNALQLLGRNLVPDAHFLQHMVREFGAEGFVELVVDAVHLLEFQQLVGCRGDAATQPALDSQEFLQFIHLQDGGFGLRFGSSI